MAQEQNATGFRLQDRCHMGAEPQNSFKGVPRDPLYGKLTTRYHILRDYVSPNQTCKVFGDFGLKK